LNWRIYHPLPTTPLDHSLHVIFFFWGQPPVSEESSHIFYT
jgi:hypothetical protein